MTRVEFVAAWRTLVKDGMDEDAALHALDKACTDDGGNLEEPRLWCNGNAMSLTNIRALIVFGFARDQGGFAKEPKVPAIIPSGPVGWPECDSEGRPITYTFEVAADLLQRLRDEFGRKVAQAQREAEAAKLTRAIEQEQPTRRGRRPSQVVQDAEIDAYLQTGQPEPEPQSGPGRPDEEAYDWAEIQDLYNARRDKGQKVRLGIEVRADYLTRHRDALAPDERHIRRRCGEHYVPPDRRAPGRRT